MKKYELTSETLDFEGIKLYRIRALKDIPEICIKAGDIGGWVGSEENLSRDGACWIFNDAKVYDSTVVRDSAIVYDSAEVLGSAVVSGSAEVFGSAKVLDSARVCGSARVLGSAEVSGSAVVSGSARVSGVVSKTPIHLSGLRWPITIEDTHMSIGCQYHSIGDWASFDDDEIDDMSDEALDFWNKYKCLILTLANEHTKN